MNSHQSTHPDAARSALRALVAGVDHELSRLPRSGTKESEDSTLALGTAWAALVKQLDLGPEPEVRACPVCQRIGMRAATVCGFCWTKLTPPDATDLARAA